LEGAKFFFPHLEATNIAAAHLEGANLQGAHLERAYAEGVHLEGTRLSEAHLEGTHLRLAHLAGADLYGAYFSTATSLYRAVVFDKKYDLPRVADIRWQGANLAVISWPQQPVLGDETYASSIVESSDHIAPGQQNPGKGTSDLDRQKERQVLSTVFLGEPNFMALAWEEAARANRQLASVMRDQGMSDVADRFSYRGQLCERKVYRFRRQFARLAGALLLDLTSGYGYKPLRSIITYLLVVLGFAAAFFFLTPITGVQFEPLGALVFSVTSFHGRGFSPGEAVTLTNLVTVLAAGEAIIGLLIEITFIATFTQRFFAR
jgi:hypothetical protein